MKAILANTSDLAEQCLREIEQTRLAFYDTETSGLDTNRNHIVGYVLKAHKSENSYYVPVRHQGGGNLPGCRVPDTADGWRGDLHPFEIDFKRIARSNGHRRWVGHFLDFDMKMSARHDIKLEGDLEDTWLNAALIDENQRSFALGAVAQYMEVTAKKGEELYAYIQELTGIDYSSDPRKSMEHYWKTDASNPVVYEYAAGDDITTEAVWEAQQLDLEKEQLWKVHGVECRLLRTLFRMTSRGVRINENALDRVHDKFGSLASKFSGNFPPGFKSNSPSHVIPYLGASIGPNWPRNPITAAERTRAAKQGREPQGSLILDEETLMLVPEGRDIILTRKMDHAQSSFTVPMKERHLYRGRVHCSFNQMKKDDFGTVSGRLSSSDPNLQQVPKRDKVIGPIYRTIFEPEEGHYWDTNDYKQQEYVVFTNYTGDPRLMAGYRADPPVDIHQVVADMLGVERDPTAKRMNLAMLYGMGLKTMARRLGVSIEQAKIWQDEYHAKFPTIKGTTANPGFLKKAERRAKQRGYVTTLLGRRRRFTSETSHKAGNGVIQGSSADITKLKMVEVDEYFASEGDEAYLMLQVHDALDNSIPIGKEYLADEARRIMKSFGEEDLIQMRVPMGIDNGVGPNWSVATYGLAAVEKAWAS